MISRVNSNSVGEDLLGELKTCGIHISPEQLQTEGFLTLLPPPLPHCTHTTTDTLNDGIASTHGFMIVNDLLASTHNRELLESARRLRCYTPSSTHMFEHLSPRLGGDGHVVSSVRGDHTCWGRQTVQEHPIIANLRATLWNKFTLPFRHQNDDIRIRADTDVMISVFPRNHLYRPHMERQFLYKLVFFLDDYSVIRVQRKGDLCSHDIYGKAGQLLVLDCEKTTMEVLPIDVEERYIATQWLRSKTGFGL
jgi:hypothetical protein